MPQLTIEKLEELVYAPNIASPEDKPQLELIAQLARALLPLYRLRIDPQTVDARCEQYRADVLGTLVAEDAAPEVQEAAVDAAAEAFHDGITEGVLRAANLLLEQEELTEAMKEGFTQRAQDLENQIATRDAQTAELNALLRAATNSK